MILFFLSEDPFRNIRYILQLYFAGPNTLINFIQSRGRARKEDSKFYVFVDSESMKSTQSLEDQERILRHLINVEGTRDRLPSDLSKKKKELFERETPSQVTEQHQIKPTEEGRCIMIHILIIVNVFVCPTIFP